MPMSRREYELIANAINSVVSSYHPWAISNTTKEVIEAIADVMANDNPRFDRERFMEACGMRRKP